MFAYVQRWTALMTSVRVGKSKAMCVKHYMASTSACIRRRWRSCLRCRCSRCSRRVYTCRDRRCSGSVDASHDMCRARRAVNSAVLVDVDLCKDKQKRCKEKRKAEDTSIYRALAVVGPGRWRRQCLLMCGHRLEDCLVVRSYPPPRQCVRLLVDERKVKERNCHAEGFACWLW